MDDSIIKIEKSLDLTKFMYKGENIWPLFRNILVFTSEYEQNVQNEFSVLSRVKKCLLVLSSVKYIFLLKNLFCCKYEYIFFTCEGNYGRKQCLTKHKLFGYLYDKISTCRNILEIQLGNSIVISDKTRKYFSYDFLSCFKAVLARFIFIGNISVIENEIKKINISLNVRKIIKRYIAGLIIDRLIFKTIQPKIIFMDSNTFWSTIKAANDYSIPTFEFQHGVVVNHTYYNVEIDVNTSFYPDYFVTFGKIEYQYLQNRYFARDIIPIGNMMIDHYYDVKNIEIQNLKKIFKYVVCVSLQNSVLKTLVDYIMQQATLFDDICFILIPRYENDLDEYDFSTQKNIKVFLNINTYEVITNSDYHITCYSTCAQEAPSLGVQNIFLNFYNASIINYEEFIHDYDFNYCIDPSSDLSIIYNIVKKDKESIRLANKKNIITDYKNNINHFILRFDL